MYTPSPQCLRKASRMSRARLAVGEGPYARLCAVSKMFPQCLRSLSAVSKFDLVSVSWEFVGVRRIPYACPRRLVNGSVASRGNVSTLSPLCLLNET